jgi:hypothetical protein
MAPMLPGECLEFSLVQSQCSGGLEERLELSLAVLGCGVISAADELAPDEHTRHGTATGLLEEVVLDRLSVVTLVWRSSENR